MEDNIQKKYSKSNAPGKTSIAGKAQGADRESSTSESASDTQTPLDIAMGNGEARNQDKASDQTHGMHDNSDEIEEQDRTLALEEAVKDVTQNNNTDKSNDEKSSPTGTPNIQRIHTELYDAIMNNANTEAQKLDDNFKLNMALLNKETNDAYANKKYEHDLAQQRLSSINRNRQFYNKLEMGDAAKDPLGQIALFEEQSHDSDSEKKFASALNRDLELYKNQLNYEKEVKKINITNKYVKDKQKLNADLLQKLHDAGSAGYDVRELIEHTLNKNAIVSMESGILTDDPNQKRVSYSLPSAFESGWNESLGDTFEFLSNLGQMYNEWRGVNKESNYRGVIGQTLHNIGEWFKEDNTAWYSGYLESDPMWKQIMYGARTLPQSATDMGIMIAEAYLTAALLSSIGGAPVGAALFARVATRAGRVASRIRGGAGSFFTGIEAGEAMGAMNLVRSAFGLPSRAYGAVRALGAGGEAAHGLAIGRGMFEMLGRSLTPELREKLVAGAIATVVEGERRTLPAVAERAEQLNKSLLETINWKDHILGITGALADYAGLEITFGSRRAFINAAHEAGRRALNRDLTSYGLEYMLTGTVGGVAGFAINQAVEGATEYYQTTLEEMVKYNDPSLRHLYLENLEDVKKAAWEAAMAGAGAGGAIHGATLLLGTKSFVHDVNQAREQAITQSINDNRRVSSAVSSDGNSQIVIPSDGNESTVRQQQEQNAAGRSVREINKEIEKRQNEASNTGINAEGTSLNTLSPNVTQQNVEKFGEDTVNHTRQSDAKAFKLAEEVQQAPQIDRRLKEEKRNKVLSYYKKIFRNDGKGVLSIKDLVRPDEGIAKIDAILEANYKKMNDINEEIKANKEAIKEAKTAKEKNELKEKNKKLKNNLDEIAYQNLALKSAKKKLDSEEYRKQAKEASLDLAKNNARHNILDSGDLDILNKVLGENSANLDRIMNAKTEEELESIMTELFGDRFKKKPKNESTEEQSTSIQESIQEQPAQNTVQNTAQNTAQNTQQEQSTQQQPASQEQTTQQEQSAKQESENTNTTENAAQSKSTNENTKNAEQQNTQPATEENPNEGIKSRRNRNNRKNKNTFEQHPSKVTFGQHGVPEHVTEEAVQQIVEAEEEEQKLRKKENNIPEHIREEAKITFEQHNNQEGRKENTAAPKQKQSTKKEASPLNIKDAKREMLQEFMDIIEEILGENNENAEFYREDVYGIIIDGLGIQDIEERKKIKSLVDEFIEQKKIKDEQEKIKKIESDQSINDAKKEILIGIEAKIPNEKIKIKFNDLYSIMSKVIDQGLADLDASKKRLDHIKDSTTFYMSLAQTPVSNIKEGGITAKILEAFNVKENIARKASLELMKKENDKQYKYNEQVKTIGRLKDLSISLINTLNSKKGEKEKGEKSTTKASLEKKTIDEIKKELDIFVEEMQKTTKELNDKLEAINKDLDISALSEQKRKELNEEKYDIEVMLEEIYRIGENANKELLILVSDAHLKNEKKYNAEKNKDKNNGIFKRVFKLLTRAMHNILTTGEKEQQIEATKVLYETMFNLERVMEDNIWAHEYRFDLDFNYLTYEETNTANEYKMEENRMSFKLKRQSSIMRAWADIFGINRGSILQNLFFNIDNIIPTKESDNVSPTLIRMLFPENFTQKWIDVRKRIANGEKVNEAEYEELLKGFNGAVELSEISVFAGILTLTMIDTKTGYQYIRDKKTGKVKNIIAREIVSPAYFLSTMSDMAYEMFYQRLDKDAQEKLNANERAQLELKSMFQKLAVTNMSTMINSKALQNEVDKKTGEMIENSSPLIKGYKKRTQIFDTDINGKQIMTGTETRINYPTMLSATLYEKSKSGDSYTTKFGPFQGEPTPEEITGKGYVHMYVVDPTFRAFGNSEMLREIWENYNKDSKVIFPTTKPIKPKDEDKKGIEENYNNIKYEVNSSSLNDLVEGIYGISHEDFTEIDKAEYDSIYSQPDKRDSIIKFVYNDKQDIKYFKIKNEKIKNVNELSKKIDLDNPENTGIAYSSDFGKNVTHKIEANTILLVYLSQHEKFGKNANVFTGNQSFYFLNRSGANLRFFNVEDKFSMTAHPFLRGVFKAVGKKEVDPKKLKNNALYQKFKEKLGEEKIKNSLYVPKTLNKDVVNRIYSKNEYSKDEYTDQLTRDILNYISQMLWGVDADDFTNKGDQDSLGTFDDIIISQTDVNNILEKNDSNIKVTEDLNLANHWGTLKKDYPEISNLNKRSEFLKTLLTTKDSKLQKELIAFYELYLFSQIKAEEFDSPLHQIDALREIKGFIKDEKFNLNNITIKLDGKTYGLAEQLASFWFVYHKEYTGDSVRDVDNISSNAGVSTKGQIYGDTYMSIRRHITYLFNPNNAILHNNLFGAIINCYNQLNHKDLRNKFIKKGTTVEAYGGSSLAAIKDMAKNGVIPILTDIFIKKAAVDLLAQRWNNKDNFRKNCIPQFIEINKEHGKNFLDIFYNSDISEEQKQILTDFLYDLSQQICLRKNITQSETIENYEPYNKIILDAINRENSKFQTVMALDFDVSNLTFDPNIVKEELSIITNIMNDLENRISNISNNSSGNLSEQLAFRNNQIIDLIFENSTKNEKEKKDLWKEYRNPEINTNDENGSPLDKNEINQAIQKARKQILSRALLKYKHKYDNPNGDFNETYLREKAQNILVTFIEKKYLSNFYGDNNKSKTNADVIFSTLTRIQHFRRILQSIHAETNEIIYNRIENSAEINNLAKKIVDKIENEKIKNDRIKADLTEQSLHAQSLAIIKSIEEKIIDFISGLVHQSENFPKNYDYSQKPKKSRDEATTIYKRLVLGAIEQEINKRLEELIQELNKKGENEAIIEKKVNEKAKFFELVEKDIWTIKSKMIDKLFEETGFANRSAFARNTNMPDYALQRVMSQIFNLIEHPLESFNTGTVMTLVDANGQNYDAIEVQSHHTPLALFLFNQGTAFFTSKDNHINFSISRLMEALKFTYEIKSYDPNIPIIDKKNAKYLLEQYRDLTATLTRILQSGLNDYIPIEGGTISSFNFPFRNREEFVGEVTRQERIDYLNEMIQKIDEKIIPILLEYAGEITESPEGYVTEFEIEEREKMGKGEREYYKINEILSSAIYSDFTKTLINDLKNKDSFFEFANSDDARITLIREQYTNFYAIDVTTYGFNFNTEPHALRIIFQEMLNKDLNKYEQLNKAMEKNPEISKYINENELHITIKKLREISNELDSHVNINKFKEYINDYRKISDNFIKIPDNISETDLNNIAKFVSENPNTIPLTFLFMWKNFNGKDINLDTGGVVTKVKTENDRVEYQINYEHEIFKTLTPDSIFYANNAIRQIDEYEENLSKSNKSQTAIDNSPLINIRKNIAELNSYARNIIGEPNTKERENLIKINGLNQILDSAINNPMNNIVRNFANQENSNRYVSKDKKYIFIVNDEGLKRIKRLKSIMKYSENGKFDAEATLNSIGIKEMTQIFQDEKIYSEAFNRSIRPSIKIAQVSNNTESKNTESKNVESNDVQESNFDKRWFNKNRTSYYVDKNGHTKEYAGVYIGVHKKAAEISSQGIKKLSALNLTINGKNLERVYHESKVFKFKDRANAAKKERFKNHKSIIYDKTNDTFRLVIPEKYTPGEVTKFMHEFMWKNRSDIEIVGFKYGENLYTPASNSSQFYDTLYIKTIQQAVKSNPKFLDEIKDVEIFSDEFFNSNTGIATQARSIALVKGMMIRGELTSKPITYKRVGELLKNHYTPKENKDNNTQPTKTNNAQQTKNATNVQQTKTNEKTSTNEEAAEVKPVSTPNAIVEPKPNKITLGQTSNQSNNNARTESREIRKDELMNMLKENQKEQERNMPDHFKNDPEAQKRKAQAYSIFEKALAKTNNWLKAFRRTDRSANSLSAQVHLDTQHQTAQVEIGNLNDRFSLSHELAHALTYFAENLKDPRVLAIIDQMLEYKSHVVEHMNIPLEKYGGRTLKQILMEDFNFTEKQVEHWIESSNGSSIQEFIAVIMSIPEVTVVLDELPPMQKSQQTSNNGVVHKIGKNILSMFGKLLDIIFGSLEQNTQDNNIGGNLFALTLKLAEIQEEYLDNKTNSLYEEHTSLLQSVSEEIQEKLGIGSTEIQNMTRSERDTLEFLKRSYYDGEGLKMVFNIPKLMTDPIYRMTFGFKILDTIDIINNATNVAIKKATRGRLDINIGEGIKNIAFDFKLKTSRSLLFNQTKNVISNIVGLNTFFMSQKQAAMSAAATWFNDLEDKYGIKFSKQEREALGEIIIEGRNYDVFFSMLSNKYGSEIDAIKGDMAELRAYMNGDNEYRKKVERRLFVQSMKALRKEMNKLNLTKEQNQKLYRALGRFAAHDMVSMKSYGRIGLFGADNVENFLYMVLKEEMKISEIELAKLNFENNEFFDLYKQYSSLLSLKVNENIASKKDKMNTFKKILNEQPEMMEEMLIYVKTQAKITERMLGNNNGSKGLTNAVYSELYSPTVKNPNIDILAIDDYKKYLEYKKRGYEPVMVTIENGQGVIHERDLTEEDFLNHEAEFYMRYESKYFSKKRDIETIGNFGEFKSMGRKYTNIDPQAYYKKIENIEITWAAQILPMYTKPKKDGGGVNLNHKYRNGYQYTPWGVRKIQDRQSKKALYATKTDFKDMIQVMAGKYMDNMNHQQHLDQIAEFIKEHSDELRNESKNSIIGATKDVLKFDLSEDKIDRNGQKIRNMDRRYKGKDIKTLLGRDLFTRLQEASNGKNLYIPKILLDYLIGVETISFTELSRMQTIVPQIERLTTILDTLIKKFVSMNKQDRVIRDIPVTTINMTSNISTLWAYGLSFKNIKHYSEFGIKELARHKKNVDKMHRLQIKYNALRDKTTPEARKMIEQINLYKKLIENSDIYLLLKAGAYTNVIDAERSKDYDVQLLNIAEDKVRDKGVNKQIIDRGSKIAHNLLLTSKSPVYQVLAGANRYGDFLSRYCVYKYNKANGKSTDFAINEARNMFVDYNIPLKSNLLRFLEAYGITRFIKYYSKLSHIILTTGLKNPGRTAAIVGSQIAARDLLGISLPFQIFEDFGNVPLVSSWGSNFYIKERWEVLPQGFIPSVF